MPIPKPLLKFLEANKVKCDIVEHRRVFTAHDKAATLHVDPKMVVKAAVFSAGKKHALVLVPAPKHIDKAKVKKVLNAMLKKAGEKPEKQVDFATEQWMKKNLPGDIGATPPFSEFLGIPVLVDNALLKQKKLYVNAGSYEHSFLMNLANFVRIIGADAVKGAFAKSPKK